ncbi:phosphoglycerate kinase [Candidatus Pacearchaeota archaeon]|nr:phosphoglycerate kinase [Candidatus Pacearchaeota archaeon]|tara:strand:- start:17602 stop:18696 length:1095 start_codon:yes stop_codon:yes gene_type:complete
MKTLDSFNFKGKTVLARCDLDSPVVKGKVLMNERLKGNFKTLKELKNKKAKVVVIGHQGRPGQSDFTSLKQHAKLLKIKFVPDIIGKKALEEIEKLKDGEVLMLENVRKLKDEFKGNSNNNLVKKLKEKCEVYVNDAFSVCHRKHTSVVGFPKVMRKCMGRSLEKELKALKKLKKVKGLYILAGTKPKDNINLLKGQKVLSCGIFGQLCLIAKGFKFGAQNKFLRKKIGIVKKSKLRNILTPIDFGVKVDGKRKELKLEDFPSKYEIYDIGEETIKKYVSEIKKAKTVFMKGTAGYCEDKKFCKGTEEILKAVSKCKFSVVGGGHLSEAVSKLKIKGINHVSLSGGTLLEYVSGKKLVGVEALN